MSFFHHIRLCIILMRATKQTVMSSCIWSPSLSYRGSVISACIGLRGLLGVNQGEFFSSHSFFALF